MDMKDIRKLKSILDTSNKIVFFTGAGISVPSGIPDFRSQNGIYTNDLKAETIISHSYFLKDPESFYAFYRAKMCFPNAEPNKAHRWIAGLEKDGKCLGVVTQNIDGLHQKAGSIHVDEIHGSIYRNHCMDCHRAYSLMDILKSDDIPRCPACGGIIKPDVVLYEEPLDERVVYRAIDKIMHADTMIIIGTSLMVYPAAGYIQYFNGENIVVINKGKTAIMTGGLVFDDDVIKVVEELNNVCENN